MVDHRIFPDKMLKVDSKGLPLGKDFLKYDPLVPVEIVELVDFSTIELSLADFKCQFSLLSAC